MSKRYALVMAGGVGTRLWPASTPDRPKQLVAGLPRADSTLLQATLSRLAAIVPQESIYLITTRAQRPAILDAVPQLRAEQVLAEPCGRNTAACIGLALACMRRRLQDELDDAVVIVSPADQHVVDEASFQRRLVAASRLAASRDTIVLLGIEPTDANPGFGYIACGEPLELDGVDSAVSASRVAAFREKPDIATAKAYLASTQPRYLWNAGLFVMPVSRVEREFLQHVPDTWRVLQTAASALATGSDATSADAAYASLPAEPFDRVIVERQPDACVVPFAGGWSDLGSWAAVAELFATDIDGNHKVEGPEAKAELIASHNCLVWTEDAAVGVIGLDDVVVVARGGRVLVCRRDLAARVGEIAKRFDIDE